MYIVHIVGCKIMNSEISNEDLKNISYDFRIVSSRLLDSEFRESKNNLQRFMNFINNNPIISEFIDKNNSMNYNIDKILKEKGYNQILDVPIDLSEEISFVYQLMEHIMKNDHHYTQYASGYVLGKNVTYDDVIHEFHKRVFYPFINHITTYLEKIIMRNDQEKYSNNRYTFYGPVNGQLNISSDKSSIQANMNVNNSEETLNKINKFSEMLSKEKGLSVEEKEEIEKTTELIKEELRSKEPKTSLLEILNERLANLVKTFTLSVMASKKAGEIINLINGIINYFSNQ